MRRSKRASTLALPRDGCPRDGEAHLRGQVPSLRKVYVLEGVFAAQGPPGMKLMDDMEDSTPPLDYVEAKSPPVTDGERGASYEGSPVQSVETRLFVAGTPVILKGL